MDGFNSERNSYLFFLLLCLIVAAFVVEVAAVVDTGAVVDVVVEVVETFFNSSFTLIIFVSNELSSSFSFWIIVDAVVVNCGWVFLLFEIEYKILFR